MTHACKIPMSNEHNMQKCPGAMEDARPTCKYASEPWEIHMQICLVADAKLTQS